MKILLLNPPTGDKKKFIREGRCTQEQGVWATLWPPISLVMIGAVLERAGHDVRIIDCPADGAEWDDLLQHLQQFLPGLVVWSTGTPSIYSDLGLAADIKKIDPSVFTAVFGTHVTVLDRQSLDAFPRIDCIIRNEPEMTVQELAAAVQQRTDLRTVAGITFRDHNNQVVVNPPRPFIDDLDSLPFPAWHLINLDNYTLPMKAKKFVIVVPQRGCPFMCSFCTCQTYYGKKLRKRRVDNVVAEIEYDLDRFNIHDFFFWAETFVVDKDYVAELCRAILKKGIRISWTCNSRVDIVDEQLLQLMARAGCWMISYGIESADQHVLDKTEKGIKVEHFHNAVRCAHKAGIKTAGHFIFGLPGDTEQSMESTIQLSKKLELDIAQFYCAVPFPGSRLYEQAVKQGWIASNNFTSLSQDQAVMNLPTVSTQAVNQFRSRAFKEFYFRPTVWYRIFKLMDVTALGRSWQAVKDYLNWSGK